MKSILVLVFSVLSANFQTIPSFQAVPGSSSVQFRIKNLGIAVKGSIAGLSSTILFDPAAIASSSITAQVSTATINTGIDLRDDHIKEEDYFDVKNYPYIKLVSTKIAAGSKRDSWNFNGKLTIKETTLDISFPFTATPVNGGYQLKGEFTINRRDFGVGGSSFTMADNVTVILDVLAQKTP